MPAKPITYTQTRDKEILDAGFPFAKADLEDTPQKRAALLTKMKKHLVAVSQAGKNGHWTYNHKQHCQMHQVMTKEFSDYKNKHNLATDTKVEPKPETAKTPPKKKAAKKKK